jgi:hypothetical protein
MLIGLWRWRHVTFGLLVHALMICAFAAEILIRQQPWNAVFFAFRFILTLKSPLAFACLLQIALWAMLLLCWLRAAFSVPGEFLFVFLAFAWLLSCAGRVPHDFVIMQSEEARLRDGDIKEQPGAYCKTCGVFKPLRTHHCQVCDRCCLKMDHHCWWLNNC